LPSQCLYKIFWFFSAIAPTLQFSVFAGATLCIFLYSSRQIPWFL
jgi:hypothetical protein